MQLNHKKNALRKTSEASVWVFHCASWVCSPQYIDCDVWECCSSIKVWTLCSEHHIHVPQLETLPMTNSFFHDKKYCCLSTFTELSTSSSFCKIISSPEGGKESCLRDFDGDICNHKRRKIIKPNMRERERERELQRTNFFLVV